ncbi:hypothetical protein HY643_00395 [Candidatus Woesearchaeota archaeon]|nr:hypothetical protein [Candidatus Woesearchaeota archaeon]
MISADYAAKSLDELINCDTRLNVKEVSTITGDPSKIKQASLILYQCDPEDVVYLEKDSFNYRRESGIARFRVQFADGKLSRFYVKKSWEGARKEAVGMELTNLLTDTPINYCLISQDLLLIEHINGTSLKDLREEQIIDVAYGVGVAEEYARFLGLADRSPNNLILKNDNKVVNIDFGHLFNMAGSYPTRYLHRRIRDELNPDLILKGRKHGKKVLQANLIKNFPKIKALYHQLKRVVGVNPFPTFKNYCEAENWPYKM